MSAPVAGPSGDMIDAFISDQNPDIFDELVHPGYLVQGDLPD